MQNNGTETAAQWRALFSGSGSGKKEIGSQNTTKLVQEKEPHFYALCDKMGGGGGGGLRTFYYALDIKGRHETCALSSSDS